MSQKYQMLSNTLLILFTVFAVPGCGTQEYELGLTETAKYYAHLEKIDINLSRDEWKGSGISIRVPDQFDLVRAPAEPEEGEEPADDPRQPIFIGVEFPGLLATWKTEVGVDENAGTYPCYIYLLSNDSLWKEDGRSDIAINFTSEVTQRLTDGLKVEFPEKWDTKQYPEKKGYVKKKIYTSTRIYPEDPIKLIEGSEAVNYQADVYLAEKDDAKAAIIFFYPQGISDSEKLSIRIPLSLETFEMRGKSSGSSSGKSTKSGKSRKGKKKKSSVGF
jgi:hypothetical protein